MFKQLSNTITITI